MNTTVFNSVFWISFITIVSGMILKLVSMCYKSKCKYIEICGGRIKCIRDTDAEEREREFELNHQSSSPKNDEI
jgi:hypothetical protein